MKIEAVLTSVGCGDFLAATLPTNKAMFDRMVVVTTPEDLQTQRVCEFWNVECIKTDAYNTKKGQFCKGAGINAGLKRLSKTGWVVHMDSDILLPPLFRQMIDEADLDNRFIYGVDRMMCKGFEDWYKFVVNPRLVHENHIFVHLDAFPMGVRIATPHYGGYVPIGFFQMWAPKATGVDHYPEEHTDAGRGDMLFAKKWPRNRRAMIPEVVVYHLESEEVAMGTNWGGRRTKPFGPCAPTVQPIPAPEFWPYGSE